MSLKGVVFPNAAEYLSTANELFQSDEILFQLAFCLATEAAASSQTPQGSFYCAVLDHLSQVIGTAQMMELGTPLIVSLHQRLWNDESILPSFALLLSDLLLQYSVTNYTMLTGPERLLSFLVPQIERKSSIHLSLDTRIRLHKCERITNESTLSAARLEPGENAETVVGSIDNAEDVEALKTHLEFFTASINAPKTNLPLQRSLGRLRLGRVLFLKITTAAGASRYVSTVSYNRVTDTTMAISNVTTLPQNASRGYATHLVAEATKRCLNLGKTAVLFTDISNPTSNHIYNKIGFEQVADFAEYHIVS